MVMSGLTLGSGECFRPRRRGSLRGRTLSPRDARRLSCSLVRLDHDDEVDDRLRRQTGNGQTHAERGRSAVAHPLKLERPGRVVVDDDDQSGIYLIATTR